MRNEGVNFKVARCHVAGIVRYILLTIFLANVHSINAYVGDYDGTISIEPITIESGEEFLFSCTGDNVERQRIDVGVQPVALGKTNWSLILRDTVDNHEIEINTRLIEKNKYDIEHDESIFIRLSIDGEAIFQKDFGNKLPITKSPIYIRTIFDGNKLTFSAGSDVPEIVTRIDYRGFVDEAIFKPQNDIIINRYSSLYDPRPIIPQLYEDEKSVIDALSKNDDARCGVWEFFDDELETRIAMRGGRYKVALLPSENGGYDIIYLSGAEVDPYRWAPGSQKGYLSPTPFVNTFTLYWIDSEGIEIADQSPYATFDGAIMTLTFPLQKAKFRFVKGN